MRLNEKLRGGGQKPCDQKGCTKDREYGKKYCGKHHMQNWRSKNMVRDVYNNLKNNAKKRRKEFDLTLEQFTEMVKFGYMERRGRLAHNLHIDRIKNKQGYTVLNLRIIPAVENLKKGDREITEEHPF